MKRVKNRLDELEFRVQQLEHEIRIMRNAQKNEWQMSETDLSGSDGKLPKESEWQPAASIPFQEAVDEVAAFTQNPAESFSSPKEFQKRPSIPNFKDNESLVGKYFIGALASLLIFIGAASFVAIVWNKISPEVKLAVVSIVGLTLSAVGLKMTFKKASNVSAIVFGTGIGLVYIAIVSANLVFHLISHEASALLCVLWTLMILFSHRYTKLYFTILIAAIGSFINLCFELSYVESSKDIMLIIAYTSVVSMMLLYMSNSLDKVRNAVSIFFAFFNFALIFLVTFSIWGAVYPLEQTVITLMIMLITNWMYRLANREDMSFTYLILTLFSTIFLFLYIAYTLADSEALALAEWQSAAILFVVILVQCVINHIHYPKIEKSLTLFYTLPLYVATMPIIDKLFDFWAMGAAPIMLLFILRKKIWKKSIPVPYMMMLILLDFIFIYNDSSVWTLALSIANLLLLFYILHEEKCKEILYKNGAVAILILAYFKISYDICDLLLLDVYDTKNTIAYLMSVITVIFIYKIGYLRSKDEEQSHLQQHLGLYIFSTLLYLFGMQQMVTVDSITLRFVIMLATLIIALFQSRLLLSDYKEIPNYIGIWLVAKYFLFTWVMLRAFWELPFESVSYSVVGLLMAVGAIYAGFKLNVNIIRRFGLGITMLMVAKFIFVDLQGENSITRVLAFVAGGVLCFIISIIYNRLSKE
ncbi:MAG: DUF2339 domain-containing protein [Peptostreptococcaceae bacterium]|nr:DUF2339 domain-containing protein [Peptostreptococcaceae bacterium]